VAVVSAKVPDISRCNAGEELVSSQGEPEAPSKPLCRFGKTPVAVTPPTPTTPVAILAAIDAAFAAWDNGVNGSGGQEDAKGLKGAATAALVASHCSGPAAQGACSGTKSAVGVGSGEAGGLVAAVEERLLTDEQSTWPEAPGTPSAALLGPVGVERAEHEDVIGRDQCSGAACGGGGARRSC
jgi:hypothetical protein